MRLVKKYLLELKNIQCQNIIVKIVLLILMNLLSIVALFAREPRIFTTYVQADGGESIEELLFDKYKLPTEVLYDKKYVENITRWNWFVKNSSKLRPNERVYIELPYRYKIYFERQEMAKRLMASPKPKIVYIEKKVKPKKYNAGIAQDYVPPSKDLNFSLFLTSSIGQIKDTNKTVQLEGSSTQNSPITIGFALTMKSKVPRLSYSSSLYLSYLIGATQGDTNDVEIPPEIGTNFYWNYNFNKLSNVYFGFDAERISSFNIESIQNTQTFFTKEHSILYATFGYFDIFHIFGKKFFSKMGISQSLMSQTNIESDIDNSPYSGIKAIFFTSTKVYKNFTVQFLAKQHLLSGPSDLSISRIGLGIGYQFH